MSASPLKADMRDLGWKCPLRAITGREQLQQHPCAEARLTLDHLVGDAEQRRGDGQSQTTWGICNPPVNATIAMVGKPALHAA